MRIYRSALVWLLRLMAVAQIAWGIATFMSFMGQLGLEPGGAAGVMVEPGARVGEAMSILLGPLVYLAVAECLAILNAKNAGNAR